MSAANAGDAAKIINTDRTVDVLKKCGNAVSAYCAMDARNATETL
jgi:hypothetical protein